MRHVLRITFYLLQRDAPEMNWWTKLLLLLGGVILLRLSTIPAGLSDTLVRADQALSAGRPDQALGFYSQVATHAEGKAAAAVGIARARLALAEDETEDRASAYNAAREAWLAAIPYEGFSDRVRHGLAETYLGMGNSLAAGEQWEALFASNPTDASLWYQLAPLQLEKGAWAAAARAYSAIAAADPDDGEAHYWAGALQILADPVRAEQHLHAAREDSLYRKQAESLLATLEDMETIAESAHSHGRAGLAYLSVGEPALAEAQFRAAVEQEPDYADAWAYLGLAQTQQGRNGRQAIAQAVELEPESALVHSLMGHHWLYRDRPDLARPEFVHAWRLDPDNPAHLADVASTYQIEGDYSSAEVWYQAAIRAAPDDPTFWILMARFYLDTLHDVTGGGLPAAQRAVALGLENPAALDVLGWAQFLAGRPELAETNLVAARERDPSVPATHYHLGELYASQARWTEARLAFQQAITLDGACRGCDASQTGSYAELAQRALEKMGR